MTEADRGVYECQVNTSPLLRQKFYLRIVGKLYIIPLQHLLAKQKRIKFDKHCKPYYFLRYHNNFVAEPYTEIVGGKDLFIDQHSSINLTCIVNSPEPPAHIFWMKNGKVRMEKHI